MGAEEDALARLPVQTFECNSGCGATAISHRRRPPSGTGFTPCRFSKGDDGSRRYRARTIEQAARRTASWALSYFNSMAGS